MDFRDKAELRAFLEKEMAFAPPISTRRGIRPPSTDDYVRALREIERGISVDQRVMLIGHAQAPGQALTMTQLAALVGKEHFQAANRQYGALGGKLITALGISSPKWKVYAIASFDDDPESGESCAHMYSELRAALLQLGWIAKDASQDQARQPPAQSSPHSESISVNRPVDHRPTIQDVINALRDAGFQQPEQSGLKVVRLEHPKLSAPVFVKQGSSIHARLKAPLVLHPQYGTEMVEWLTIPGLERGHSHYYHNDDMTGFPKRINSGKRPVGYGVDIGFRHSVALQALIARLLGQPASMPESSAATPETLAEDLALTDTEREALIKARIGQSGYRDKLLAYWGGCAVTGCRVPQLLLASHIKPWRAASPSERLDPFNGLLLSPNLDLAFDKGLLSFDDQGLILLGSDLDPASAAVLNITENLRLRQIDSRHRAYLAWHREYLFRD
jgi:hypothetical protein